MMGSLGLTGVVVNATFAAVSLSLEKYRKKKDLINCSVGGFVAGAAYFGYAARSIPMAIAGRRIPMAIAGGTLFAILPPIYSFFK